MAHGEVKRGRFRIAARGQRIFCSRQHDFIGVEPEGQGFAGTGDIGGDEGGVLHRDGLLFVGGDQPVLAMLIPPQQTGEGADHGGLADFATVVEPAPVRLDHHQAIPAVLRVPLLNWRQLARGAQLRDFGKAQAGKIRGGDIGHIQPMPDRCCLDNIWFAQRTQSSQSE